MDDLLSNAVAATILALVAFAVGVVYRRPALVHGLWLLVLLKLVTPPLLRIPVAWPTASEVVSLSAEPPPAALPAPPEEPVVNAVLPRGGEEEPPALEPSAAVDSLADPPAAAPSDSPRWPQVLYIIWVVGSLAWFLLAAARLQRFRRLLRFARPAPAALQERTRRLARSLGLTHCPRVLLLPGRIAPMLWTVGGSPRLLVPADLLKVLSDEQLDTLLVHELAHLRRRDHWVRALEFVVMGLYWWHPVVWYARRELREAEEQCCDAWVVFTLQGTGRTYASALLDTLDFLSTAPTALPPLASGLGPVSDLKRRLTMILRDTTPRALSWPGCFAMLALGVIFLPMLPAQQAQAQRRGSPQPVEEKARSTDLEKARADLAALEAELRLKKADLERAKAALGAAAAGARSSQPQQATPPNRRGGGAPAEKEEQPRSSGGVRDQAARGADATMIRIEILVSADDINVEELRNKLASVLPEKNRRIIIHSPAAGASPSENPRTRRPGAVAPAQPDAPSTRTPTPRTSGEARDQRINELEQKLERLLSELRDLRPETKGARPETSRGNPSGTAEPKPKPANPTRR